MQRLCFGVVIVAWMAGGIAACGGGSVTPEGDGGVPVDTGSARDAQADAPERDAAAFDGGGVDDAATDDAATLDGGSDDAGTDAWIDIPDAFDLPDVTIADAGPACPVGEALCGGATCIDLATDSAHCGECGVSCAGPNELGAGCFGGECMITACQPGYADLDGSTANGCEAAQDFTVGTDFSVFDVSVGGSLSIRVQIDRVNGFPYGVSVSAADLPPPITATGVALSGDVSVNVLVSVPSLTTPGRYPARIVASATVGGSTVVREVPIVVNVVASSVVISSVVARDATGALPSNQARQNMGTVTLHVTGTGLLTATAATLEELPISAVAGGTDTARDYRVTVGPSVSAPGDLRSLTLALTTPVGVATFAGGLVITPIAASSTSGDDANRGTIASPYRTLTRALAAVGVGSRVALHAGTYSTGETWSMQQPDGLVSVTRWAGDGGTATLACSSSTPSGTALWVVDDLAIADLTFSRCDTAVRSESGGSLTLARVTMQEVPHALAIGPTAASLVADWRGGALEDTQLTSPGGQVHLENLEVTGTSSIDLTLTRLTALGLSVHDVTADPVMALRSVVASSGISFSSLRGAPGTALLVQGAVVEIDQTSFAGNAVAIETDAADVTLDAIQIGPGRGAPMGGVGIEVGATTHVAFAAGSPSYLGNLATGIHVGAQDAIGVSTIDLAGAWIRGCAVGVAATHAEGVVHFTASGARLTENTEVGLAIGTTGATGGHTELMVPFDVRFESWSDPSSTLIDVGAGTGILRFTGGSWSVPRGRGLYVHGASQHDVQVGDASRSVTIAMVGHPYDFRFGVQDDRFSSTPLTPLSIRASFVGVDGLPRTWSGVYSAPSGSYVSSVSPRDLASWLVSRSGRIDFGAP